VEAALDDMARRGRAGRGDLLHERLRQPAHEQAAAAIARRMLPRAYLSVSTEVLPSIRFYERVSTTALNAYVGPKLGHYLDQLVERLGGIGFAGLLLIMQSNGGVIAPQAARDKAALTLLSGPAGGPGAGLFYAEALGQDRCITTDMGGTSFEASVAVGAPHAEERRRDRAPQDRAADARHPHHRRRRRLDRLAGRRRPAAHGPAKRRRGAWPGLLRPRRPCCPPPPTPTWYWATSTPATSPAGA
jgi:hypothetical protein